MVKETRRFIYEAPYQKAFGQLSEKAIWPDLMMFNSTLMAPLRMIACSLAIWPQFTGRRSIFLQLQGFIWREPSQPKGLLPAVWSAN
jgi:hypothetical protein